jgi:hypothetical protein
VAGRARLSAGAGWRLAALLAIVVLVHVLALDWFARRLEQTSVLRPLATPMFTRLLRPEAPVAAPAPPPKPAAARPKPKRPTVAAITRPAGALPPASAASAPEPPQPVAQPSQEPASSPESTTAAVTPSDIDPGLASAAEPAQPASAASAAPAQAAPTSTLDSWPADTRLNYRLYGQYRGSGEFHGNARVQWQRESDRYQTKIDVVLTSLLTTFVMTSQGEVTPQGLLPRVYEEQRSSGARGARLGDETIALANGSTVPRPPGVQDSASQFVDLSHRFASGKDVLEVGRSVSYWMARPGAVDLWTFDIVGKEMLQSPELGSFEAFHLKPRPIANPRGNITAEMWFAPSLQYLPVRIRVNMGDATYLELMVVKIEQK